MSIELLEPDIVDAPAEADCGIPPIYGKCPVCHKPLFPRNKKTGAMQAPPINAGYESRAKCGRCGAVIVYVGQGEWRVLGDGDLTDADREADAAGRD